ncbi:MAG TPA: ADP-ribosylglycohydrolase family protein [Niastella sp.]
MKPTIIHNALFGVAIGDALGVPVEMIPRATLDVQPVQDLLGYKAHNKPPGTFSDDSSMTFCLAESLCHGYDVNDIAQRFVQWFFEGYWTPEGQVFGVGKTTENAVTSLKNGAPPNMSGNYSNTCNGNGSLMRTLPLLFYIRDLDIEKRYAITKEVSSITHGYIRPVIACFYYLEFALELLNGKDKQTAYHITAKKVNDFLVTQDVPKEEIELLALLLHNDISTQPRESICSLHHVIETIKAAMYCFMKGNDYKETVLMAVNLGDDTDTTAAVAGGLAGLYYGIESIPEKWIQGIIRSNDINDLCNRFAKVYGV